MYGNFFLIRIYLPYIQKSIKAIDKAVGNHSFLLRCVFLIGARVVERRQLGNMARLAYTFTDKWNLRWFIREFWNMQAVTRTKKKKMKLKPSAVCWSITMQIAHGAVPACASLRFHVVWNTDSTRLVRLRVGTKTPGFSQPCFPLSNMTTNPFEPRSKFLQQSTYFSQWSIQAGSKLIFNPLAWNHFDNSQLRQNQSYDTETQERKKPTRL